MTTVGNHPGSNFSDFNSLRENLNSKESTTKKFEKDSFVDTLNNSVLTEEAKNVVRDCYNRPRNIKLFSTIQTLTQKYFWTWKNSEAGKTEEYIERFYNSDSELQDQDIVTLVEKLYQSFLQDCVEKKGIELSKEALKKTIPGIEDSLIQAILEKNDKVLINSVKNQLDHQKYYVIKDILEFLKKENPQVDFKYDTFGIITEIDHRNSAKRKREIDEVS